MGLFSPDSKFMRAMSRLGDLMILNLIFLLSCVPLFTIGAACTALYTVCFRFDTKEEGRVLRTYFRSFKANFKQATALWLILLVCGGAAAFDGWLFLNLPGASHWLSILFAALLLLALLTASMLFPLLSQFQNGNLNTLKNALALSLGYLPRSVLMTALCVFPFALLWKDLYLFLYTGFLWVALYFSAVAFLNTKLLKKVFAPYREVEE